MATITKTNNELLAAYQDVGLSPEPGGYPINPTGQEAYDAGYQRGLHWAFENASRGKVLETIDTEDATYSAQGEVDGYNRGVSVLGVAK